jgi:hypothetical protein
MFRHQFEIIAEHNCWTCSIHLWCQMLCLRKEEVSLWSPGAEPQPSRLVVAKYQVIPAQCEGVVMAGLETPLGVESGLVELSPEADAPKGLYIARTLI